MSVFVFGTLCNKRDFLLREHMICSFGLYNKYEGIIILGSVLFYSRKYRHAFSC